MRANLNRVPSLLAIGLGLMLVGCGGGGGGGGGTPGTVTIIEPAVYAPQLVAGTTLRFEAKVANGNGSPLSWGVQTGDTCTASNGVSTLGTPGGDATLGTMPLSSANKTEITYTAPNTPPPGAIVTVTALQSPNTTGPCAVIYVVATTNDLFNFRFVFRLRGFSGASGLPFAIVGRFNTDGNGKVTNGLEDVNIAQADGSSVAFVKVPFTGTYNMDSASHGTMTLTVATPPWAASPPVNPPPSKMNFSFTMSLDGSYGALIETDGAETPAYAGSGDYQFQGNNARFTTANIVGAYVVSLAGTAGVGAAAVQKGLIGRLDLSTSASTPLAGTIVNTSRSDDQSAAPTQTLTGVYTIDDQTNGHGVFNVTGGANPI